MPRLTESDFMDYLVTGGAGYIGGHVVDYLLSKNNNVIVVDNESSGRYKRKESQFIKSDLATKFSRKLDLDNPTMIHLAANPDVKASMGNIYGHYSSNVTATLNALELARKIDASSIIFSSTSAVYGNAEAIPTPESYDPHPISNYGLFKVLDEEMLKYYSENYGIKSVALRFANITGGRCSHGILYNFVTRFRDDKPIEIWGDGKQSKSYIYISDLIDAMMLANNKSKKKFDVFNIGNKDSCNVRDIVNIFKKCAGPNVKSIQMDPQPGDIRKMQLDIKKISSLGWAPKHSSKKAVERACNDLLAVHK